MHGIPYIIGAINEPYIYALTPVVDGEDQYCRKFLHSTNLWRIVGPYYML